MTESKPLAIAKEFGHEPEDIKSVSVEPGKVIVVTTDGERHEYQENRHDSNPE